MAFVSELKNILFPIKKIKKTSLWWIKKVLPLLKIKVVVICMFFKITSFI